MRFPDLYQALQIPKGCIIEKKKNRESTNSKIQQSTCLIQVELGLVGSVTSYFTVRGTKTFIVLQDCFSNLTIVENS